MHILRETRKDLENKKKKKAERPLTSGDRSHSNGGDAFPSGIDIAYQRRNRNRHARREGRYERTHSKAEEIHACSLQTEAGLRRSIYGIARRVPTDLPLPFSLSRSLSPYPPSRPLFARPLERRSFLPVSVCGWRAAF